MGKNNRVGFIVKKTIKVLFFSAIALILMFILLVILAGILDRHDDKSRVGVEQPPVATVEHLKPTKKHPDGSIEKYHYRYGALIIDKEFAAHGRLDSGYLFAEINTYWPEFGKSDKYFLSDEDKRLRIMFEINKLGAAEFRDIYSQVSDDLNPYGVEDNRFPGFFGYKRRNGWLYVAKDSELLTPQGTPVAILCSDDDDFSYTSGRKVGGCRYTLVFDEDLKAQVRFNKPLMNDFVQVHKDLLKFVNSVRENK